MRLTLCLSARLEFCRTTRGSRSRWLRQKPLNSTHRSTLLPSRSAACPKRTPRTSLPVGTGTQLKAPCCKPQKKRSLSRRSARQRLLSTCAAVRTIANALRNCLLRFAPCSAARLRLCDRHPTPASHGPVERRSHAGRYSPARWLVALGWRLESAG